MKKTAGLGKTTRTDKLSALKSQMKDMSQDYEDMIKAREAAKKALEARFNEVYRQIEENKQFTIDEGKRVMDTLKAFQDKFEERLVVVDKNIEKEITEEKTVVRQTLESINKKLDGLDQALADEKAERIRKTEEDLAPIRKDIDSIFH